jgi:feruloyl esterase
LAASSGAAVALPSCADLATNPAYGLAGNAQVSNLTAAVQAQNGLNTPYCRVDFVFTGESGPSSGYLPGQSQRLTIRVGLPPNSVDMANPIATGAVPWNGKNRDLGGGGYAGAVGGVTSSTNLGYVGTSTDTGHSAAAEALR